MASTYSPTLRIELIGTGDQSGLWGDTTNNNLGDLIEQAITGVESIPMIDADYTLSALNGSVDEARNAVIVMTSVGSLTASRNVLIPAVDKLYTFKNSTTGGQNIVVKTSGGTGVTVPNGQTASLYCDGTDCHQIITTLASPAFTGTPTAPTASANTNTTQVATTAFVTTAISNAFPSGTKLMFAQASAPTGWTQVTDDTANNRMLRVVSSAGGGTGGAYDPTVMNVVPYHTHSLSTGYESNDHAHYASGTTLGQNADHTHDVASYTGGQTADHNHQTRTPSAYSAGEEAVYWVDTGGNDTNEYHSFQGFTSRGVSNDHAHFFSATTNGASSTHAHDYGNWTGGINANHYHTGSTDGGSSSTNWTPRYIDMILCTKN